MSLLDEVQLESPLSSMLASIHSTASAEMSLATTSVPGTSLAMRTDLEPVAAMASPTRMRSLSRARRSMTLTSLLKDICSLKNTGPIFLPGPWVEWSWGTRILVPPSVMMEPSGLKRSHRS